ncbi:unnamed protein product [Parnassius apollo]|uniref:(apollo) hypothetical protein n=1 Tax=Parnassius apollo TaxID=110799 RepID=A0A8S3WYG9_PARAO|nr:unnamed protein product [Parnassius apollo]
MTVYVVLDERESKLRARKGALFCFRGLLYYKVERIKKKIASISCAYKNILSVEQTGFPPTYLDNAASRSTEKLIWRTVTGNMPIKC